MTGMRLAGIDDALELRVREDAGGRGGGAADAAGRRGAAARPRPWRPTARAWSDAAWRRRYGSPAARSPRRGCVVRPHGCAGCPVAGLVGQLHEIRRRRRAFDEAELRQGSLRPRRNRADGKHGGGGRAGEAPVTGGRGGTRRATQSSRSAAFGGHAGRGRKGARVLGRDAVDHREPRVDRGAVAGIGLAGERRGEDDAALLLQADEALAPGRLIGTDIMAGDGDEPSALGETRQRRADMADRGFGKAPLDMGRGREGRVHQHHARPDRRIEMVVDLLGVVPADRDVAEQAAEQPGARLGDLVQGEPRLGELGEDRQEARPGGGFQNEVGRSQCSRLGGDEAERDRGRELLELLRFLGPARLRRQPLGQPREHVEHRRRRARAGAHGAAEFAQEQDLRRLERLVGVLPHPRPCRVGAAEGGLHRGTQRAAVEGAALPEQLREQGRGMKKPRDLVGRGLRQEQREGCRGGGGGCGRQHGRDLRERGSGEPGQALSFSIPGSPAPGFPLPLDGRAPAWRAVDRQDQKRSWPGFAECRRWTRDREGRGGGRRPGRRCGQPANDQAIAPVMVAGARGPLCACQAMAIRISSAP